MTATLRTWRDDHRDYCLGFVAAHRWAKVNDVRRCDHDRILIAYEPPPGWGFPLWRGLSPLFDPIRWRRARKALQA